MFANKPSFILISSICLLLAVPSRAVPPARAHGDEIAELRRQLESLRATVGELQQQVNQARIGPVFGAESGIVNGGKSSVATEPIPPPSAASVTSAPSGSLFNPEISVAIDTIGSYSRRADNFNFLVRDAEVMLQANVDQLAHAYAVFNAETELDPLHKTDAFGEINLGVEEAALETTSLPWGLQLKAGQFFADVTRLGKVHSHDLPFTDRPRSLDLLLGGESKARGLELSWVPPLGHYFRFTGGVVDNVGAEENTLRRLTSPDGEEGDRELFAERSSGGRAFDQLTYYARAATILELGSSMNLNLGANILRGREAGTRQLASGDFKLSWTPRPDSFDLLELSGEYLWSRQSGRLIDDYAFLDADRDLRARSATARGYGGYVYAQYRFGKVFQPGLRFDYLHADRFAEDEDADDGGLTRSPGDTKTLSAYVNFHLSEFDRLRFQVNYVQGERGDFAGADDDWQAFLQWTITLGPHKHPFTP